MTDQSFKIVVIYLVYLSTVITISVDETTDLIATDILSLVKRCRHIIY